MKNLFYFLPFILLSNVVLAKPCIMTVVAESGLSLREKPTIDSKRLAIAKFGEIVFVNDCYNHFPPYTGDFIEIGGQKGFWIEVYYKDTLGYMFSGYLVEGDLFPNSRIDTLDLVIIDEIVEFSGPADSQVFIDSFEFRHYTSNLNWYGVKVKKKTTEISKVEITLTYNENRWKKGNYDKYDVYLSVENEDEYDFLLGSKKILRTGQIESKYHQNKECNYSGPDYEFGVFLYLEQRYYIDYNKDQYRFKGKEEVKIDKNNTIIKQYGIQLRLWEKAIVIKNKKDVFNLRANAEMHATYKNPKLFWSADLNDDGYLDFIFEVQQMRQACGVQPYWIFLYSELNENSELEYNSTAGFRFDRFIID